MRPSRTIDRPASKPACARFSGSRKCSGSRRRFHSSQRRRDVSVLRSSSTVNPICRANRCAPAPTSRWWSVFCRTACATLDGVRTPSRRGHAAGPLLRAVHAARIELHDTLGVGQPAVADARVLGIEFDDVDAGDEGLEHVAAAGHQPEGAGDAGLLAVVRVLVAVGRRDDDRLGTCSAGSRARPRHAARGREPAAAAPVRTKSRRFSRDGMRQSVR